MEPTVRIRFVKKNGRVILQQLWEVRGQIGGDDRQEWRDVELVEDGS